MTKGEGADGKDIGRVGEGKRDSHSWLEMKSKDKLSQGQKRNEIDSKNVTLAFTKYLRDSRLKQHWLFWVWEYPRKTHLRAWEDNLSRLESRTWTKETQSNTQVSEKGRHEMRLKIQDSKRHIIN